MTNDDEQVVRKMRARQDALPQIAVQTAPVWQSIRRRRAVRAGVGIVGGFALLVAAGFSLQDWRQREGSFNAASSASPTVTPSGLQSVPQSFTSRTELTACGAIETVTSTPSAIADAWTCLDHAVGAELTVTTTTEEGDPIVAYYRVSPDIDGLEIFRDATADTFASPEDRRWSHQECPGTVSVTEPLNCHEV